MSRKQYVPASKFPQYKAYHTEIDRLMLNSVILNGGNKKLDALTQYQQGDRAWLTAELISRLGDQKGKVQGYYFRGSQQYLADIPAVEAILHDNAENFLRRCGQTTNEGKEALSDYPPDLLNIKLVNEAKLYILRSEVEELERRLKSFTEKDEAKKDRQILKDGPRGVGQMYQGQIVSVDGLPVINFFYNDQWVKIIDCPDHEKGKKYDGISTADYYTYIVNPWLKAVTEQQAKNLEKARREGLRNEKLTRGFKEGLDAPVPELPEGTINYKKLVENEELIRTK